MENTSMDQDTKELSVHDCWKYLQSTSTCRIALINGNVPEIFPVNYIPNFGTILFRTGQGTKHKALREGTPLALEADGFNRYGTIAWSVIIKGHPEFVTHPEEIQEAVNAGLSPWQPGAKDILVRVTPTEISGRRFVITPPSKWWPPLDPSAAVDDTTDGGSSTRNDDENG
ncbi:pyridoxamine 5'-phosphate oxidase family protein [Paenarthrobacter sp. 2TAF44]|uniref:pyridoxamine 5'-phosphate oxidase family protein n=1 Tax=Paenarthrobacter sp. 2TAF44 TaxID=3233018 RepID=UPI003F9C5D5C